MMTTDAPVLARVLSLIKQLTPGERDQVRLELEREAEEQRRDLQRQKNQAAIGLIESWLAEPEDDDGDEDWDTMLHDIDAQRGYRKLFSESSDPSSNQL
jgi:hypothetical protein